MLNPFPIMWLSLVAYTLLRLVVAGVLIYIASTHWTMYKVRAILIFGIALFTLIGLYTQYAMLALLVFSIFNLVRPIKHPRVIYVLLAGIASTLFITGAGVLAFDLPL